MQVHILGSTPQIRGKQLEVLTQKILEHKGYTNLSERQIASGGHEIDVAGELQVPMISKSRVINVICECKAHGKPVGTTDWLKFLGKVYMEECASNGQANGCFISLNGVNGNVSGSYKKLKSLGKDNIDLVTGEELFKALLELFPNSDDHRNRTLLAQQTSKKLVSFSLAYYEASLYWVFSLEGDTYTVMDESGRNIEESHEVVELLKVFLSGEYIDLAHEKERGENERDTESKIYTVLVSSNGEIDRSVLLDDTRKLFRKSNQELSDDIFDAVLSCIEDQPYTEFSASKIRLRVSNTENRVLFLKRLLSVGITIDVLKSCFYRNLIDEGLVQEIEHIQCGISISHDHMDMCLKVLFLSPSALAISIHPIQLIAHHRGEEQSIVNNEIDEHDNNLYLRLIVENFMEDYKNSLLSEFYYSHVGVEEVDFSFNVKLKTKQGIYAVHENRRRVGIGEMSKEYGGGIIPLLILNSASELWER